jgi:enamine deaminase RidA (YjgF/YER057c/UK114 family)
MPVQVLGNTTSTYSLGIVAPAGRLIFISGTIAVDEKGRVIAPGNLEKQARFIFEEIGKLLAEAGANLSHVVKLTTYVTDMTQYSRYAIVRKEVFGAGPYPASATVGVAGLVYEGLVVEIEAVAVVP